MQAVPRAQGAEQLSAHARVAMLCPIENFHLDQWFYQHLRKPFAPEQLASRVQERLGAHGPAFDVQAACTGFLYAMSVADRFVSSGETKQAIVIGSETLTKIINFKDRGTCVVFGDGAGAVVLGPGSGSAGIKSCVLGSDGSGGDLIYVAPGADGPEGRGRPEIRMDGRRVFRFATEILAQATLQALEKANVRLEDVKLIVPHQANARIIEAAAKRLGVGADVMVNDIANYGNTSTASIPLALKDSLAAGRLKRGDHLVLVGFGAGLTWGACVIEWEGAPVRVAA